ncbi:MAG: hypothetical protein JXE06_07850 [Coriobacteriia bacterium]|nr:hypothetical protein [Coriobacteriia bacterium]MBN2822544.1 hypothetical protein [Coriobacteriia bacterium]
MNSIRRIYHPALYQGGRRKSRYFEGWYFKLDAPGDQGSVAIIPGLSLSAECDSHAFVQFIRSGGATSYFRYPASEFSASDRQFEVTVGPNHFSESGISLDLEGEDEHIVGEITFSDWSPWPVTLTSPGIMGPYRFVPFMECYHGVLSMDHEVSGIIETVAGQQRFDGGRGYAEKDWGRSFPRAWVWAQCNGFDQAGVSVTLSVARIPWMRSAFTGVIAGILVEGTLFRFATYTGAQLEHVHIEDGEVRVVIADDTHRLTVSAAGATPGQLRSPVLGEMQGTVYETLGGTMEVTLDRLTDDGNETVYEGVSERAGLELMDPGGLLGQDER